MRRSGEKGRWQKRRRFAEALEGSDYNSNSSSRDETEVMEFTTAM